ncbi:peptidylprolyl isomerase [Candidatus Omnitrophota bacterium]
MKTVVVLLAIALVCTMSISCAKEETTQQEAAQAEMAKVESAMTDILKQETAVIEDAPEESAMTEESVMTIGKGKKIAFDYALTVDGNVIDKSEAGSPLTYVHGEGGIIPGLQKRMEGLKVGDERTISVPPEEAYGAVNPDALQQVPRTSLPPDFVPQVGVMLSLRAPDGRPMQGMIVQVNDDTIVVNFNHPLAGKTLEFVVKVVSIE